MARGIWASVDQRPLSKHVPGLATRPWHEAAEFPFAAHLARHWASISREYTESIAGESWCARVIVTRVRCCPLPHT